MADFFYTVISVSLAAALSGFVAYRGVDKWHKLAVSIILLSVISTPIFSFVSELSSGEVSDFFELNNEDIASDEFERVGKEAFEKAVCQLVAKKAAIPEGSVYVLLEDFDCVSMRAKKIKITLVGEGLGVDYRSIENYIRGLGLGDCEVKYGLV